MDKDENAIHDSNKDTSLEEVEEVRTEGNNKGQRDTFESNRVVVAINEDELKKNKNEQGNETIILSKYDSEETVRKDREDGDDLDESTAEVLIFADTLLKSLKRKMRKVKQNGNGKEKLLN